MNTKIIKKFTIISKEKYVFFITLLFNILLLIINPPNKIIALFFVLLLFIYYLKIRSLRESLFLTFFSSLIITTGKNYAIQTVPSGVFIPEVFPYGYFINITVTSSNFLALAMLLFIIRDLIIKPRQFKPKKVDFFIIVFFSLKLLSAILGSNNPDISLPIEIISLRNLIAYFYVRTVLKNGKYLWRILIYILAALVMFESALGLIQLQAKSPLGKNIENQVNIEYFGHTVGESLFKFRPVGTFEHANALGIWLAASSIFLFAATLTNKSFIVWVTYLFGCLTMVTTLSRSAWLGCAVGLFFLIIYTLKEQRGKYKFLLRYIFRSRYVIISGALILFVFFIAPRLNDTIYSFFPDEGGIFFRKIQILDSLQIIRLHPILGIGAGMATYEGVALNLLTFAARVPLEVHNWFISIALENGLLSLGTIIVFIYYSLYSIMTKKKSSILPISVVAMVICSITAGVLNPSANFDLILPLLSLANND